MKNLQLIIKLFFLCFIFNCNISSQSLNERYSSFGKTVILNLKTAMFPHPERKEGHTYDNKFYSFEDHYNDSSALVFIPTNFRSSGKINLVIHFHGWNNNIDSVASQYKLIEQFYESNKNALLIIPQGPKNSPDSFGGKLEEKNGFKNFVTEILEKLYKQKNISTKKIGNIILSGHSGGYRVISYILMRGGLTKSIKEVFLFDGLYADIEKYVFWFTKFNGKFIDIFTENGGTKENSEDLMKDLKGWNIPFTFKNENELNNIDLKQKLIFIYSDLEHNDVLSKRNQYLKYLKTSFLQNIK